MKSYIEGKIEELLETSMELFTYKSLLKITEFITEFDYATIYLSRLLKVKPFVVYLLLFKKAYFEEGQKSISVKLSELGRNLLSDSERPMSDDAVRNSVNDLVKLGIVKRSSSKPGQANEYEIRLPSEIREVQEMIARDKDKIEESDDSKEDFYKNQQRRLEILKRDNHKCCYCLRDLKEDNFYLDHLVPKTQGGQNYKSNLVASCRACNNKKSTLDPEDFLLQNYRKGLLKQEEHQTQRNRLKALRKEYRRVEHDFGELPIKR